jgi:flavin reductase (DIM6/NTAB) family NADH-FMN oxidoreductase RutF/DNA-binding IclR family transcriptional regulator
MTTPIDSRELRNTLGAFTTGVTVVTTVDSAGKRHGVTANSFSSVSLDPPLILWSQALTSRSYEAFRDAEHFVVNIMADDQVHVSNQFAKSGDDKFAGIPVSEGIGGVPIIDGSAAHFECTKVAAYPGGDHVVYLGRIEKMNRAPRKALAFGEGRYMVTFAHDLGGTLTAEQNTGSLAQVEAVRLASAALPEICQQIGDRTVGLAVWGSHGATIVRWEPSKQPVSSHLQTGVVVSLTRSATGTAFAAYMDRELTQPFVDRELALQDANEKVNGGAFAARLLETQQHGLARSVGGAPSELHQVTVNAFSAPVFNAKGEMVLAISTTCRADALSPDWDGDVPSALLAAARRLSTRLGYVGAPPAASA